MFNNKNVYEIETALAIYEFMDKDINSISDAEIFRVYNLIHLLWPMSLAISCLLLSISVCCVYNLI